MENSLPKGWKIKSLDGVCTKITDGSHFSPKTVETGYNYISVKDLNDDGNIDFANCKKISQMDFDLLVKSGCKPLKEDVLLSKDGTVGKVAIVNTDTDFVVLSSLAILRPDSKLIASQFLAHILLSPNVLSDLIGLKTGAAIKRIVLKTIKSYEIPLPPLPEQQRLVAKLDVLFERIDRAIALVSENIENTKHLMASVLNDIAQNLSATYKTKRFDTYLDLCRGHNPPKSDFIYEPKDGYVRFIQIRDGSSDLHAVYVPDTKKLKRVSKEELLLVAYRQIGKVFREMEGAFNVALCKITNIDPANIDTNFVYYIIQTDLVKGELLKRSERALIPSMSVDHLASIEIPIPPIDIQRKISNYIELVQQKQQCLLQSQQLRMAELKQLKSSLLHSAFRGEL